MGHADFLFVHNQRVKRVFWGTLKKVLVVTIGHDMSGNAEASETGIYAGGCGRCTAGAMSVRAPRCAIP